MKFLYQTIPIFVFYLSNFLSKNNSSNQCLAQLYQEIQSNSTQILTYFDNSGKGINQLGNYYQCIQNQRNSYYLANIALQGIPTRLFIGICITNKCTAQDILQLTNNPSYPYSLWSLYNPQEFSPKFSTSGYIVIGLLGICTLCTIIATIMTYKLDETKVKKLKILNKFSLQKTLQIFTKPGQIKFLNGIRSIAFLFVVLGHQLYIRISLVKNLLTLQNQVENFSYTLMISYAFAVDIFFYVGGFMVGFLFLKMISRNKSTNLYLFTLIAILKRILRFWPMYILCTIIYWKILPVLGNGPLYSYVSTIVWQCKKYYWSDLLFFGNFRNNMCLNWTWYIQADIQLFIISLFTLLIYWKSKNKIFSYILQLLIIISTMVYCFIMCQIKGYHTYGNLLDFQSPVQIDYQIHNYIKPWSRTGPYFLGVILGVYYFQYLQNKKKHQSQFKLVSLLKYRVVRYICTIIGFTIIFLLTYMPVSLSRGQEWTQIRHSLYLSIGHIAYAFGFLLISFPFLFGYSNFIRTFLQFDLLQHISKISFSAYMIHYIIIVRQTYNSASTNYWNGFYIIFSGICDLVIILALGFFVAIIFEFPIAYIIEDIIGNKKEKKNELKQKIIQKDESIEGFPKNSNSQI